MRIQAYLTAAVINLKRLAAAALAIPLAALAASWSLVNMPGVLRRPRPERRPRAPKTCYRRRPSLPRTVFFNKPAGPV